MQQVIKGDGCFENLPLLLRYMEARQVLFVTGEHLLNETVFKKTLDALYLPYERIGPPPGVLQLDGIPTYATLDTVVAIGGGKVMDFAKGIIHQYGKPVRLVAVPTTAGSGSEATPIAVFYRDHEKVSLDDPTLLPTTVLLDPVLLENLSASQRALSGADALAQCIESIWNVHSTEASESFAREGLALLWQYLPPFVLSDSQAHAATVLWAAYLSGKAIAMTRTTGPHALSYFLTAHYGVPHGQAVALTLPLFFMYNEGEKASSQLEKIATVLQVSNAEEACTGCRAFFRKIGLATTLTDLGLHSVDPDQWLQSVNQQRFANNPVAFDRDRLNDLFRRYLY